MMTVFGGSGYIGTKLTEAIAQEAEELFAPGRDALHDLEGCWLGDIVYCIGITSDFRRKLRETFDAHFSVLKTIVTRNSYNSITYLSSTKVYDGCGGTNPETPLLIQPMNPEHVYAASKIAGECFVLNTCSNPRVVRLSNVYSPDAPDYGSGNFLDSILRSGVETGSVHFQTSPESEKDYISLTDAVKTIVKIVKGGANGVFNVARGYNTANSAIARFFNEKGVDVSFPESATAVKFPVISIDSAVCCPTGDLEGDLPALFDFYASLREQNE